MMLHNDNKNVKLNNERGRKKDLSSFEYAVTTNTQIFVSIVTVPKRKNTIKRSAFYN